METRQPIGTSSCQKSTAARQAVVRYCLLAWEGHATILAPRKFELNLRGSPPPICIDLISPLHPPWHSVPCEELQVRPWAASLNQIVCSFGLSRVLGFASDHNVHLRPAGLQRAQSSLRTKQQ